MRSLILASLSLPFLVLSSCVSVDSAPGPTPPATGIRLSDADAKAIGKKIWQNECGGTVEGLTTWNAGEDFPSLGIGHFIWYVKGREGPFEESFPPLLRYLQDRKVEVPAWLAQANGSPWTSRDQFQREKNSAKMRELRTLLVDTVPEQTGFIVLRLERALPKMKQATPNEADRRKIHDNFYKVASTRTGIYALIDYVNFKGEGTNPKERYKGEGWGLRDVLLAMEPTDGGQASANAFSEAAKYVLERRIKNSPPSRGESRWRAGWMNRCETYKRGI